MAESVETFQISLAAAETYEAQFVPALFGEWAPHLVCRSPHRSGPGRARRRVRHRRRRPRRG